MWPLSSILSSRAPSPWASCYCMMSCLLFCYRFVNANSTIIRLGKYYLTKINLGYFFERKFQPWWSVSENRQDILRSLSVFFSFHIEGGLDWLMKADHDDQCSFDVTDIARSDLILRIFSFMAFQSYHNTTARFMSCELGLVAGWKLKWSKWNLIWRRMQRDITS